MQVEELVYARGRRERLLKIILYARKLAQRVVHLKHRNDVRRECSNSHRTCRYHLPCVTKEACGDHHAKQLENRRRQIDDARGAHLRAREMQERLAKLAPATILPPTTA